MTRLQTKFILFVGLGVLAGMPGANASERDQRTVITFSGPVEMPGQVLPAGTYVFKLHDSPSNRHIVQVFRQDEKRVFGTFLAIPHQRPQPAEKTIVTFHERSAGMPEAIRAWFYPGRTDGHEFVYPKREAIALAQINNTPVPAIEEELTAETTKPALLEPDFEAFEAAPIVIEKPNGDEVTLAAIFAISAPPPALPEELPATGSALPLIGLAGLLSLAAAGGLRLAAVRNK